MKKIIISAFAFGSIMLTGCNDFLDVKPSGKFIPQTVADFSGLLDHTATINSMFSMSNYSPLMARADNVFMSDNPVIAEYTSSHLRIYMLAAYSLYYPVMDPTVEDGMYGNLYKAVSYFNNVIEGVKEIGKDNDPEGQALIAQARAGRAWVYLHMGLTYGMGYNPNGDNSSPTIAYRTNPSVTDANPGLSTVEELFKLAEADYLYAVQYAPKVVSRPVQATRLTSKALLAELYMHKGDFENMYKYASEAWSEVVADAGGADGVIYDYNNFSLQKPSVVRPQPGEDEEYFYTLVTPDGLHKQSYNRENLFYRQAPTNTTFTTFQLSPDYLALFKDGDLRRKFFVFKYRGYNGTKNGVSYNDGVVETPVIMKNTKRTIGMSGPMLLLMVAESAARTSRPTEAMVALRQLRAYRYETAKSGIADLSGDDLVAEILRERRLEQTVTSPERYWDLCRFVYEAGKPWSVSSLSRTNKGVISSCQIDSREYHLPFSNIVINYNPHWGATGIISSYEPYTRFQ